MRTPVMTQALIRANINRLQNNKPTKHNANRLKYWLFQQKQLSTAVSKVKKGVNES